MPFYFSFRIFYTEISEKFSTKFHNVVYTQHYPRNITLVSTNSIETAFQAYNEH